MNIMNLQLGMNSMPSVCGKVEFSLAVSIPAGSRGEILPTGHPSQVGVAPGAMSFDRRDWFQQLFGFKEAGLGLVIS